MQVGAALRVRRSASRRRQRAMAVVAREQHRRARPARASRRAGPLRVLEAAGRERFVLGRTGRSRARPGPAAPSPRSRPAAASSPPGQHVVADAAAPRRRSVDDALVDALVAAADQRQRAAPARQLAGRRLIEQASLGVSRIRRDGPRAGLDGLERGGDRLDPHHHPRPAAVGRVVDLPVRPSAKSRGFVRCDRHEAGGDRLAEQRRAQEPVEQLRERASRART